MNQGRRGRIGKTEAGMKWLGTNLIKTYVLAMLEMGIDRTHLIIRIHGRL